MNAQNIVDNMTGRGFSLWLSAGKLMVKPKADDATRETLRQHKAEIIQYLMGRFSSQPPKANEANENPIDSIETPLSSSQEEILHRLGLIAVRAVQFAGKLKDSSPEQNRIAGLLDQAHEIEILEPLDTVKLAKVIGELMAAASQKPEGLKSSEPGQQLLMTGT